MRRRGGPAALAAAAALAMAGLAAPSGPLAAQGAETAALDSVEVAADSGRVEWARRALERWMERRFAGARPPVRARARLLQGRLAEDPEEARRAYALVAVDGGIAAARARLRLAQLHLARGRHGRALDELATVRADAPGSGLAAEAWLWTGRVREAEGEAGAACEAYRRAASASGEADAGLREAMSRAMEACRRGGGTPAWRTERVAAEGAAAEAAGGRRFAVQLGAFSRRESARDLRRSAAEAGFDVRLAGPDPGDGLLRVRSRAFERESEAERLARRIEDAGFRAIVVEIGPSGDES